MADKRRISFAASAVEISSWDDARLVCGTACPEVGERRLREVLAQVERLAEYPESGRVVPEFELTRLREIIHPPFRIVDRGSDHDRVRVVRVWRSERLLVLP